MKKIVAIAGLTFFAVGAQAAVPGIEFSASAGVTSNSFDSGDLAGFDISDSADVDSGTYVRAELKLPIIPNITFKHETLVISGDDTLDLTFLDETFSTDGEYEIDLTHTDLAFTYGLGLGPVAVNAGLNFRMFDGGYKVEEEGGTSASDDFAMVVPMAHLGASIGLPANFVASADYNFLNLGDTGMTDLTIKGTWYALTLPTLSLGVEAGYKTFAISVGEDTAGQDTSDIESEISTSGFFLGATFKFD